jgi:acyl dehydratase
MDLKRAQGWATPPIEFPVGEHLCVAAYAKALAIDEPELCRLDAALAAGRRGRPVPPPMYAFFHVVPTDAVTEELGFTWGRTLAAAVDFEADRIVTDADCLTGQARVDAVWERPGRDGSARQFLRLVTDFRGAGGELVCRNTVLFMERKDGPADDVFRLDEEPPRQPRRSLPPRPTAPLCVRIGAELPAAAIPPVDRLMLARMSVAIENPDPIHLDDDAARAAGLPGVIGHGTTVVGLLYEPVRRWAGLDRVVGGRTTQSRPFGPGVALTATGRFVALQAQTGRQMATCETSLVDGDGAVVGRGTFEVVVS